MSYYIYMQGMKVVAKCGHCDKELTKKQVKDWEINQFTYACSEDHFEELL